MSKKIVIGKDGDANTYCIRILEEGQKITDEIEFKDQGQLINTDRKTISPIMSILALTKFSSYWKDFFTVSDDTLKEWLSNLTVVE